MDFDKQRQQLLDELKREGITDQRVLAAIEAIPRERFVPASYQALAYDNSALPIGEGQTISQPFIVALMTQSLALTGSETVLEIGTGSGYQAAILASLCHRLVTMERLPGLAKPAEQLLSELGFDNIEYVVGDGTLGWPEAAPYDGIIVTAAAPAIPGPLYDQLRIGGKLVIPIGGESLQELQLIEKRESGPDVKFLCDCRFVKLIGEAGWPTENTAFD
ncbi:MAG: protein-L-isoaspartate(D-aspartate) O-methyltransferase [Planctomycetaceae bacterium]